MKFLAAISLVIALLAAPTALAGGIEDATAGLDALNRGDSATAVRLLTQALRGGLSASDRELAFVKRAQAYIGQGRMDLARADLERALNLDPKDKEAAELRLQAQNGPSTGPTSQAGRGSFAWPDGSRYEGEFRDGKPEGRGVIYFANGDRYEGDVSNDNENGLGIYTLANGRRYEGGYLNGKQNGHGVITCPSGESFVGEFRDGKANGHGLMTAANGTRYEGEYRDGKLTGHFITTYPHGVDPQASLPKPNSP